MDNSGSNDDYYVNATIYDAKNDKATGKAASCPGKEITCLVLGGCSLFFSVTAIFICYIMPIAIPFALFGAGCGWASYRLKKQIDCEATVITKKCRIGYNLARAGVVCGGLAIVFATAATVVLAVKYGAEYGAFLRKALGFFW